MKAGNRVDATPLSDGRRIRWTLEQVFQKDQCAVRLDWLRFTVSLDAITGGLQLGAIPYELLEELGASQRDLVRDARGVGTAALGAIWAAREGARKLVELIGVLEVGAVEGKPMDYYSARCAFVFEGATVGYCLAGGNQSSQASTVHFNLHGAACLQLSQAQWDKVASFVETSGGRITRVDLACDIFTGLDIKSLPDAYLSGAFDVRGKRPSQMEHGSWTSGHSRTFQVGQRETGKCCRVYEKGHQLFGPESNDPWVRVEVEIRNSSRVVSIDTLRRPADFFAGAYPYCENVLQMVAQAFEASRIPTHRLVAERVAHAAVASSVRWVARVAAPSVRAVLRFGAEALDEIALPDDGRMPGRLRGFSHARLAHGFEQVARVLVQVRVPSQFGPV